MDSVSHFISCDWGTTNFRLRLVEAATLQIIGEHKTNYGVKECHAAFMAQTSLGRQEFYLNYLEGEIEKLPKDFGNLPIVTSGMASSNLGLKELPYAALPFGNKGARLICEKMLLKDGQTLLLVSGVRSKTGMMRGEEVQAMGLEDHLSPYKEGTLLLPGTHSKHISYRNGNFYALKNFMTGELFEVLMNKSILTNSIEFEMLDSDGKNAFLEGFNWGFKNGLTPNLLTIRTMHVVEDMGTKGNYFRLSGLLIGDELSYLGDVGKYVFLAASKHIFELYKMGLETFVPSDKLILLEDTILERALLIGQRKMLLLHAK
ncbi:2-dehydro-3-deoxygalactonokinase [Ulvibacterium sp.]|uniref:2-dehydro-3-deoxygalactonokinase n=1 Tax=Ulvibacterium sp. TaxID=2665914 RepID=UPI003CC50A74